MLIQPEPEEEEEDLNAETQHSGAEDSGAERPVSAGEEGKKEEAKEAKPDAKKKDAKPAKGKKDAKKVEEVAADVPDVNAKPDPNANKFCPDIIRLSRPHCNSMHAFQQILNYSLTLKPEESFAIVFEDGGIDSLDVELVDFAFGAAAISQTSAGSGGIRYLSLSGLGKPEKSVKVQRYSDIVLSIASQITKQ